MNTETPLPPESIPTFKPTAAEQRDTAIMVARENLRDAGIGDKNVTRHFDNFLSHVRIACYGQSTTEIVAFLLAQFAVYLIRQIKRK